MVEPKIITESDIKRHLGDRVSAMRLLRPVVCALESESKKPKEVRIVSLDQNLSDLVRALQEKVSFPLVAVSDLGVAANSDVVFDCVAVNQRASLVTKDLLGKTRIYVDISKQAITKDGALSFDIAVFDSLKLARHLPSIAGEAFNLRSSSKPDIPRTFDLGPLMNGNISNIDGMRPIFTVIGRPAVDAAITQHIFANLANISPDQYLAYAIRIAESKKDDF